MAVRSPLSEVFGVTERTVYNWHAKGMPKDEAGARAWHAMNVRTELKGGGKQPGAGRPKGSRVREFGAEEIAAQPAAATAPPESDRARRLKELAEGKLSRAEIERTVEETKALEAVRKADLEAGKLLVAADAAMAWGELLQAHKTDLDALGQRVEAAAGAELRLSAEQGAAIRRIVEGLCGDMGKRLADGEWSGRERP